MAQERTNYGVLVDTFELVPKRLQKSFYRKAFVKVYERGSIENIVLQSYDTDVLLITRIKYFESETTVTRLWRDWSVTTSKHITEFMERYGLKAPNKKEWLAMNCKDDLAEYQKRLVERYVDQTDAIFFNRPTYFEIATPLSNEIFYDTRDLMEFVKYNLSEMEKTA